MAYNELIKSFSRVRNYMRGFYVRGFESRDGYTHKSARSYDNEKRRVESWLGEYMKFGYDRNGKRVFLSIDSRGVPFNPLYKSFKAKSFTDNDIMLHFILMDLLREDEGLTMPEIMDRLSEYLAEFDTVDLPDESSVRKKLAEYEKLGIVKKEKHSGKAFYLRSPGETDLESWGEAAAFFSEAAPLGVVGSYLLDKLKAPDHFRFKHHYILNALDSEIMYALFLAMGESRSVTIEINKTAVEILPLKIYIGTRTGRQYVLGQSAAGFRFFRLNLIDSVTPGGITAAPEERALAEFQRRVWGVSVNNGKKTAHLEMIIHTEPDERFVVERLLREKRCGTVTELENGDHMFSADVYDALEMLPWIRSFTGRIVSLKCTDPVVEERFYKDLDALQTMYGGDSDAVL